MNRQPLRALLILLSACLVVTLGTAPLTAQTSADPAVSAEQAVSAALELLDRLEEERDGEVLREELEEVNGLIISIQKTEPGNRWIPYLYGRAFALMGRTGDAIDELRKFVDTREGRNEWKAFRLLGDLFIDEFPRLAKSNYERAAELKAGEPSILYGLSVCVFKLGDNQKALELAEQAAGTGDGKNVRYIAHVARLQIAVEQWGLAERFAARALELARDLANERPGERKPLEVVSAQYQLLIDLLEARTSAAGVAADDFMRLAGFIRDRSEIAAKLALYDALDVLELGVETIKPNTPPALLQEYAVICAQVGRTDAAVGAFERLLALDPANTVVQEWLERLKPQHSTNDAATPPQP